MTSPKWTAGPWRIGPDASRESLCPILAEHRGLHSVAHVPNDKQGLADAALISAAPELYEALDDAVHDRDGWLEKARAALGKAVPRG